MLQIIKIMKDLRNCQCSNWGSNFRCLNRNDGWIRNTAWTTRKRYKMHVIFRQLRQWLQRTWLICNYMTIYLGNRQNANLTLTNVKHIRISHFHIFNFTFNHKTRKENVNKCLWNVTAHANMRNDNNTKWTKIMHMHLRETCVEIVVGCGRVASSVGLVFVEEIVLVFVSVVSVDQLPVRSSSMLLYVEEVPRPFSKPWWKCCLCDHWIQLKVVEKSLSRNFLSLAMVVWLLCVVRRVVHVVLSWWCRWFLVSVSLCDCNGWLCVVRIRLVCGCGCFRKDMFESVPGCWASVRLSKPSSSPQGPTSESPSCLGCWTAVAAKGVFPVVKPNRECPPTFALGNGFHVCGAFCLS